MSVSKLKSRDGKKVPRYVSVTETVEVEVDSAALHDAGWHHENECPAGYQAEPDDGIGPAAELISLRAAMESLHRQAHGDGPVRLCRSRPCSSLSLNQLRGVA